MLSLVPVSFPLLHVVSISLANHDKVKQYLTQKELKLPNMKMLFRATMCCVDSV